MITGELKNKVDGIWDIFWSNGVSNPLTVIEQLTYLMFIKILDDNETRREADAAAFDEELDDPTFDADHQNCRWSIFRNYEPEAMFDNMVQNVFPFIKNDLATSKDAAFAKYMDSATFLVGDARTLTRIVDKLEEIDLDNRDIMGDVYEYMLAKLATSKQNGQFRTPRHIINMMTDLMEPTPEDIVCDPAMGSAGFICAAVQYVKEHYASQLLDTRVSNRFQSSMFTGHDTDPTMMRIGAMNLMLHGVNNPNITRIDSLSEDNEIRDAYTLIMANPPFRGSLNKETIAKDLRNVVSTTKTELLFLALFLRSLKLGGRCASIVPDGVVSNTQKAQKAIRKAIIENNRLQAVISMPNGVFRPYSGVSTAILIFTRTDNGGTDNVWFYDMEADGFSLDDKRDPVKENDIPDIIERFHNLDKEFDRARTEKSFMVPVQEIIDNNYDLSINKYKEIVYEKIEYPPTSEILADLKKLNEEIAKGLAELEGML